jgi:hypothetical protein
MTEDILEQPTCTMCGKGIDPKREAEHDGLCESAECKARLLSEETFEQFRERFGRTPWYERRELNRRGDERCLYRFYGQELMLDSICPKHPGFGATPAQVLYFLQRGISSGWWTDFGVFTEKYAKRVAKHYGCGIWGEAPYGPDGLYLFSAKAASEKEGSSEEDGLLRMVYDRARDLVFDWQKNKEGNAP